MSFAKVKKSLVLETAEKRIQEIILARKELQSKKQEEMIASKMSETHCFSSRYYTREEAIKKIKADPFDNFYFRYQYKCYFENRLQACERLISLCKSTNNEEIYLSSGDAHAIERNFAAPIFSRKDPESKSNLIIGLVGKKQVGKSTMAREMLSAYLSVGSSYKGIEIVSFGNAVKEMLIVAGICAREELYKFKTGDSRALLQKFGTDIVRNQIDPDFWVKKVDEKISTIKNKVIVIDDVRFKNEAAYIKEKGGILIKICRPGLLNMDNHESEVQLEEIKADKIVYNNGSLESFNQFSKDILIEILTEIQSSPIAIITK